jgi:hypothetical protein
MANLRPPSIGARGALAKQALASALKTRRKLKLDLHEAICVYDAAEHLGIEVRFVEIPSMEGMYVRKTLDGTSPHILVAAARPAGRQAMTAGHEIGHHVFGHGTRIDQYLKGSARVNQAGSNPLANAHTFEPEEFLAQTFGSFFLMPKSAVDRGFAVRGLVPARATASEVFRVAGWLGVGYSALVHHMCWSLKLVSWRQAETLLAAKLPSLGEELVGSAIAGDVYVVDHNWTGRPLDLKVGDVAVVPSGAVVESSTGQYAADPKAPPAIASTTTQGVRVVEATSTGIGRIVAGDWAVFVRVAEREYAGRNLYRHLTADPDDADELDEHPEHGQAAQRTDD